ncbi:energy transducer TonB [Hymenobacter busanensis]|uniref:Energy transducer TonB n=1 Tax=Hymenobacter busanensis TaxID=2607656 RepID=A0A7L4ZZT5_9BACT|nr:energy transducer TonB [Hymenobacter busanensis]KAA9333040.1 energy transducer TonB [Hymenobacter busanensis]QHJ08285.1 TonB family protein [Hymenobacter busanensis]
MKSILLAFFLILASHTLYAQGRVRASELDSGRVEKGKKVGLWSYYAYTGSGRKVLVQRYDHSTQKLLYFRQSDDRPYRLQQNGEWKSDYLDRPPLFLGGDGALSAYTSQLQYPEDARQREVQGRVVVTFVVDTLGAARDHKVLLGIGNSCDQEALRVAKLIPAQWIPGRKNGRAVPVEYELPFVFRVQNTTSSR